MKATAAQNKILETIETQRSEGKKNKKNYDQKKIEQKT